MKLAELARPLEVTRHGLVQRLAVPPGPLGWKLSPQSKSSVMPRKTPKLSAARTRIVSVAGIRLDHRKSVRPFKGIFCDDISEFESSLPSHAVGSLWPLQATASPSIRHDASLSESAARAINTSGHIPIPRVAASEDPSYSPSCGFPRCLCWDRLGQPSL